MKILMLSDVYFPRVNGVSTSIQTFRGELQRLGHEVWVVAPAYEPVVADEDGISRVLSRQVLFDPEDRMMRPRPLAQRLRELQSQRFELVHIQTPFVAHYAGIRLARRLGVPCLETYHTFFEEYLFHYLPILPKSAWRAVARLFSRRQCNQLDGLVVPSQAMREVLGQYGVQTPMRVIPTGMPLDAFQEGDGAAFRARYGIAPAQPTLVFVGRVAFEKNIEFLLRVTRALKATHPDVVLIIAGEGPAEGQLQRLGSELGLDANLRFVGYLARGTALASCYQAGDVFVFASRTETQGLVLLEAMSLGVPVVSTAIMGTRDILTAEQQGALVAQDDLADFTAQVRRLLDDAALRQQLSREGRLYARRWAAEGPTQTLLAFYQDLQAGRTDAQTVQAASKL